jgi:hypothetical protein
VTVFIHCIRTFFSEPSSVKIFFPVFKEKCISVSHDRKKTTFAFLLMRKKYFDWGRFWKKSTNTMNKNCHNCRPVFFCKYSKYLVEGEIHVLYVKPIYTDLRRPFCILEFDHFDKTRHIRDISNTQYINDSRTLCSYMKYPLYLRANHIVNSFYSLYSYFFFRTFLSQNIFSSWEGKQKLFFSYHAKQKYIFP